MIVRKQATVSRLEGKQVVLSVESGQELILGRDEVAATAQLGDLYAVHILPEAEALLEKDALARTLLNQLLSDDPYLKGEDSSDQHN